ncbi:MAG: hypothetical protein IQL11_07245 [Bacteroidales bacterium]|nr:hypothetical protein [Bacteroidales bacterium]
MVILLFLIICKCVIAAFGLITDTGQVAEKVYLHSDRAYYYSGDDIWFKAYVIDPSTNRLSLNTNNLHAELIDPKLNIIQSRIIRIEGGTGHGDFNLGDSLESGRYIMRGYTNHMRNYDTQFFFTKDITVINPSKANPGLQNNTIPVNNKRIINFFPEGGSLVDNVASTVAFKAVNASGGGCEVAGEIYSSSGDSITSFKSNSLGLGSFIFRPAPGSDYYAVVKSNSATEIRAFLPGSFPTGIVMSAHFTAKHMLFLVLRTNSRTFSSMFGKDLNLILSSRNLNVKTVRIKLTSLISNYELPVEGFTDGVLRITVTDDKGLPLCERLIFSQNSDDVVLKIETNKNEYKPREKVNVSLSLSGDSSSGESGAFSLSAADDMFTEKSSSFTTSIASWFLLESDVNGPVEEPSYYFDPDNKDRGGDLDLLLLTQGWRDFIWKYDSAPPYNHEIGFNISGKVKRIFRDRPLRGVRINMGIFGKNIFRVLNTETNSSGSYIFREIDLTGEGKLLITATDEKNRIIGRLSVDSLFYEPEEVDENIAGYHGEVLVPQTFNAFKQEAAIKLAERKKYRLSDTLELGEVFITAKRTETHQERHIEESRRLYGSPDKMLVINPAMENSSLNILELVWARFPGARNGLIFLDGTEVDPENIWLVQTLPIFTIDRVDVMNPSAIYGMRGANGAINIITRIGTGRVYKELDPGAKAMIVRGFDEPRIYYSPTHDNSDKVTSLPDTRITIFWEPNIYINRNTTATIGYYNADKPSTINIIAEGMTDSGIPVCSRISYAVK